MNQTEEVATIKKNKFLNKTYKPKSYLLGLYVLLFSTVVFCQQNSKDYLAFKNSLTLSNEQKEQKIDSIFNIYEKGSKFKFLVVDLYDFAKWQDRNTSLEKAIETSKKCVELFEKLPVDFNEDIYKRTVNNLGLFYGNKQDYLNSYKTFKKASTIGKVNDWTADAYRLMGRNLRFLGDYYKAAQYYETSITVARGIIDYPDIFVINCIGASVNYKLIGTQKSFARGIEILNEAIVFVNTINSKGELNSKNISSFILFDLYNHLGSLYNEMDEYDFNKSKLNYDKSLAIALDINKPSLLALVYNDLGYLYLHNNQKSALEYFDKALQFESGARITSTIYENKSNYFLNTKNQELALQNIQYAIDAITTVSTEDFKDLPSREAISICKYKNELIKDLITKSMVWLAMYNKNTTNQYLLNALETLKLADYLVDVIRFETNEQQSKLFWRKTASQIYSSAVRVCFFLNRPEDAFYFMEKNKAVLLLEDITLKQQKENANLPERIAERELYLKGQISNFKSLLNKTEGKKDSIRSLLLKANEVHTSFIDSLQTNYPIYHNNNTPAKIISLKEAQTYFSDNDKVFIEYSIGNRASYGLLITKENLDFFEIKDNSSLKELSIKYRTFLESPLSSQKNVKNYNDVAYSLFQNLFPEKISEKIKNKKLIIIPDSYLQGIPFEALHTSKEDLQSYFIKQHDISYAYSVSFLDKNKKIKRENNFDFLGFAPVNFSKMPSLLESKKEIDYGASQFSSNTFFYKDATKQNFINNTNGNTIIHLASHSNASDSENPWIAFNNDEKFTLDELYLTKNSADLVVLSACETSLGELNQGEGVMSLARGFFNTGANSVLSTLWNVNDKSSSKIIADFYKHIKKGKTKSEALRLAKLNYLNTHQLSELSPYYWSSFILVGDANHLPIQNNNTLLYIFIAIFILLFISYLAYRKQKH